MSETLLTAAQMRALEQSAIESGAVTGLELMERAGRGAVEAILAEWPDLGTGSRAVGSRAVGSRAVVLCGPGNNGGDGFVVARLLAARGWAVEVLLWGDPEKLPPDARANHDRWRGIGAVSALPEDGLPLGDDVDVVVDGLFGTGLSRPLARFGKLLRDICDIVDGAGETPRTRVVALDVPSGLCADSGRVLVTGDGDTTPGARAWAAAAHLTVTFHAAKPGQVLADGPRHCGRLRKVDIGLAGGSPADAARRITGPGRALAKGGGHKFDHGHILVLAGGVGRGGAARMAARAALRIGAGLVTVVPPPSALIENACHLDAIMLRSVVDAEGLAGMLEDERINALCLGPGLGTGEREAALVARAVSSGRSAVFDADALTLLARDDGMRTGLHAGCVLTPHLGEFARLAPDLAHRLAAPAESGPAYSKLDAARDLAARLGCTVLLKGADTIVAGPSGRAAIHVAAYERAAPWLATAGAGDVLAGIISGLLARGLDPMAACEAAAWLHVEAARAFGPGLIAEDLPETLPRVLRDPDSQSAGREG